MTEIVPIVPVEVGGGNSSSPQKQVSPSKKWCFTLNNYSSAEVSSIRSIIMSMCDRGGFGFEKGEEGTPHLQGFVEFKKKCRPIGVFNNKRMYFEKMKGTVLESIDYCSKDGQYWAHGHKVDKPLKLITELYDWQIKLEKIIKEDADDRKIEWYWEVNGKVGKSSFVKYLCAKYNALISSGKGSDMKYMIVKYKEKYGYYPDVVIFDVPRSNLNYLSYTGIEEIKNGCFASTKYECEVVLMNSPHIIVFANEEPDYDTMSKDRWNVVNIDMKKKKKEKSKMITVSLFD